MEDIKDTIARNLTELRTNAKLTQLQLAGMLNYSDKAVSKWERGEAIPDLRVLIKLSEIYGITVDEIVKGKNVKPQIQPKSKIFGNHAFITAMSMVLVWFIATIVFIVFYYIPQTAPYAYLAFVVAPLPTAVVFTVFSLLWYNRLTDAIGSTCIVFTIVVIAHVFVLTFTDFKKIYLLYIVAAVLELLIILWFVYRWFLSKKKKINNKEISENSK